MVTLYQGGGLLGFFSPLFVFIASFAILYGAFEYTKLFGDESKKGIRALLAFVGAALLVSTRAGIRFLEFFIPWLLMIAIAVFFILLVFRIFGVDDTQIKGAGTSSGIRITVFIILGFLIVFGLFRAFDNPTPKQPDLPMQATQNNSGAQPRPGYTYPQPGTQMQVPPPVSEGSAAKSEDLMSAGSFGALFGKTFSNPKVLGMVLTMLVAYFAMLFLTGKTKVPVKKK